MCTLKNDLENRYILTEAEYEEARKIHANCLTGREISDETRLKHSITNKGKKLSQESKDKISKANKGRKFTEEQRRNMGASRLGKSRGPTPAISKALKGRKVDWGNKISETRITKSIAALGKNPAARKVRCIELNLTFGCAKEACIALNLDVSKCRSIRTYCLGKMKKLPFGYHWEFVDK